MRRNATTTWRRFIYPSPRSTHSTSGPRASAKAEPHILKVAAEIRLTIYELVFAGKLLYDNTDYYDTDNSNIFAVLHTCTVMRNEATPIFYQTVRVELSQENSYQVMNSALGEGIVKMVANVHFGRNLFFHLCGWTRSLGTNFDERDKVLRVLPGLKVLILEDNTDWKRWRKGENGQNQLSEDEIFRNFMGKIVQSWFSVLSRLEYSGKYQVFLHANVTETQVIFSSLVC